MININGEEIFRNLKRCKNILKRLKFTNMFHLKLQICFICHKKFNSSNKLQLLFSHNEYTIAISSRQVCSSFTAQRLIHRVDQSRLLNDPNIVDYDQQNHTCLIPALDRHAAK